MSAVSPSKIKVYIFRQTRIRPGRADETIIRTTSDSDSTKHLMADFANTQIQLMQTTRAPGVKFEFDWSDPNVIVVHRNGETHIAEVIEREVLA